MDDNYINKRLEESMETPREIPYNPADWASVASRLDANKSPMPKNPYWHYGKWSLFAIVPLLVWNLYLQHQVNRITSTVALKQTKLEVLKNEHSVTHDILQKNNTQVLNNKIISDTHASQKIKTKKLPFVIDHQIDINNINNIIQNETQKTTIWDNSTNLENISKVQLDNSLTENPSNIKSENKSIDININTNNDIFSDNSVKEDANIDLEKTALPSNIALHEADKINSTIEGATNEIADDVNIVPVENDKNETIESNAAALPQLKTISSNYDKYAFSLEGGLTLSKEYKERTLGIGFQYSLNNQWLFNTGLQFQSGIAIGRDSIPESFPHPMHHNNNDEILSYSYLHRNIALPISIIWQPKLSFSYLKPYVGVGTLVHYSLQRNVSFEIDDHQGNTNHERNDFKRSAPFLYAIATIGVETKNIKNWSFYSHFQYRQGFGKKDRLDGERQQTLLQAGIRYHF